MATQPTDPWLALAGGIIANAAKDARRGSPEAAEWLTSDECAHTCEVLNFDFEAIRRWALNQHHTAKEAARMETNKIMNTFIKGRPLASQPQQATGLSDEQEAQVLKYVSAGATLREAMDLVAGYQKPVIPAGNAGSGTQNQPPGPVDMNAALRHAAGRE